MKNGMRILSVVMTLMTITGVKADKLTAWQAYQIARHMYGETYAPSYDADGKIFADYEWRVCMDESDDGNYIVFIHKAYSNEVRNGNFCIISGDSDSYEVGEPIANQFPPDYEIPGYYDSIIQEKKEGDIIYPENYVFEGVYRYLYVGMKGYGYRYIGKYMGINWVISQFYPETWKNETIYFKAPDETHMQIAVATADSGSGSRAAGKTFKLYTLTHDGVDINSVTIEAVRDGESQNVDFQYPAEGDATMPEAFDISTFELVSYPIAYPAPVSAVRIPGSDETPMFRVINMSGITTGVINADSVNGLPAGLYIISDGKTSKKILVK